MIASISPEISKLSSGDLLFEIYFSTAKAKTFETFQLPGKVLKLFYPVSALVNNEI